MSRVSDNISIRDTERNVLVCTPGEGAYPNMPEEEIAQAYEEMAIKDYDKLIDFAPDYNPEKPDHTKDVGDKGGMDLELTVFADQPVTRVGAVNTDLLSSSYLYNVKFDSKLLPDLDIVELWDSELVDEATNEIIDFYESYDWEAFTLDKDVSQKIDYVSKSSEARDKDVVILDSDQLQEAAMKEATRETSYSLTGPCF